MNASTTPEPVPTSSIKGEGIGSPWDLGVNLSVKNRTSDVDDSVSRSRNESSAGSYTRLRSTCEVHGVGNIAVQSRYLMTLIDEHPRKMQGLV